MSLVIQLRIAELMRASTNDANEMIKHHIHNLAWQSELCSRNVALIHKTGGCYPGHKREFLGVFMDLPRDVKTRLVPCLEYQVLQGFLPAPGMVSYDTIENEYLEAIRRARGSKISAKSTEDIFSQCRKAFDNFRHSAMRLGEEIITSPNFQNL